MRDFIIQAEVRGIQLSVHGDRLDVKAPKGTLTPEIVSYMKNNKASLIRALSGGATGSATVLPPEGKESFTGGTMLPVNKVTQSHESTESQTALPKSVYACLDYLRRTKFEKPLTEKLQAWLARDPAVTRYESWLI